jgi:hypothetical protein
MTTTNKFKVNINNHRVIGILPNENNAYVLSMVAAFTNRNNITLSQLSQFREDTPIPVNQVLKKDDNILLSTMIDFYNGVCIGQIISRINWYGDSIKKLKTFCY